MTGKRGDLWTKVFNGQPKAKQLGSFEREAFGFALNQLCANVVL